jgi:hypothetical protein
MAKKKESKPSADELYIQYMSIVKEARNAKEYMKQQLFLKKAKELIRTGEVSEDAMLGAAYM